MVRVTTPVNITVKAGNGHNSKDKALGIYGDQIGIAGVEATNVTLDGGDAGTARTSGLSKIGITGSKITGNLTIKSGSAPDQIGVGDDSAIPGVQPEDGDLIKNLKALLVDPDRTPIDLHDAIGKVTVSGILSISTGKYSDPKGKVDDGVLIRKASATQINMNTGSGQDLLTFAIDPNSSDWPTKGLIDGGSGLDKLSSPMQSPIFKSWIFELLVLPPTS